MAIPIPESIKKDKVKREEWAIAYARASEAVEQSKPDLTGYARKFAILDDLLDWQMEGIFWDKHTIQLFMGRACEEHARQWRHGEDAWYQAENEGWRMQWSEVDLRIDDLPDVIGSTHHGWCKLRVLRRRRNPTEGQSIMVEVARINFIADKMSLEERRCYEAKAMAKVLFDTPEEMWGETEFLLNTLPEHVEYAEWDEGELEDVVEVERARLLARSKGVTVQ